MFVGNLRIQTTEGQILSASQIPALIPSAELISELLVDSDVRFALVVEKEVSLNFRNRDVLKEGPSDFTNVGVNIIMDRRCSPHFSV